MAILQNPSAHTDYFWCSLYQKRWAIVFFPYKPDKKKGCVPLGTMYYWIQHMKELVENTAPYDGPRSTYGTIVWSRICPVCLHTGC